MKKLKIEVELWYDSTMGYQWIAACIPKNSPTQITKWHLADSPKEAIAQAAEAGLAHAIIESLGVETP